MTTAAQTTREARRAARLAGRETAAALNQLYGTETRFQNRILALARSYGWRAYHTWNSRHSAAGFPDLVALRGGRQVVAEVKLEGRSPEPEQAAWLRAFAAVPGVEAYFWKPSDFGEIDRILRPEGVDQPMPDWLFVLTVLVVGLLTGAVLGAAWAGSRAAGYWTEEREPGERE